MERAAGQRSPGAIGGRPSAPRVPRDSRSRSRAAPVWRNAGLPWALAQAAILAAGVLLQVSRPLNHDLGWLMVGAHRLLGGEPLYREGFVDVNPPASLAVLAPAAAAAGALALSDVAAARLWLFALAIASLLLCCHIVSRSFAAAPEFQTRGLLCAASFALLVLPGHDFGEREHLILLLLLPQLLCAAARAQGAALGRALSAGVGAAAGAALSLKPQYALVVAAAELAALLTARRARRPAAFPVVGFGALALVFVLAAGATLLRHPDYLTFAVPLAIDTYGAYQSPLAELAQPFDLLLLASALLAACRLRPDGAAGALARTLAAAGAGAWLAHLAGGTWWPYHRYPFHGLAWLALVLAAFELLGLRSALRAPVFPASGARVARAAATALALALLFVAPLAIGSLHGAGPATWPSTQGEGDVAELVRATLRHGRGGAIWLPASTVDPAFPAVNHAGVGWASRFSCLWPLPTAIQARARPEARLAPERRARLAAIEAFVVASVVEDLERGRPDLIFVPHARERFALGGIGVDFLAYLLREPRFAKIWSRYAWVEDTRRFRVFARRQG